jgi:hypothetical protein
VWSATAKAIVALGVGIYLVGLVLTLVGVRRATTCAATATQRRMDPSRPSCTMRCTPVSDAKTAL